MKDVDFSIITVCYNSEKTIERTINSVLSQSYSNYEFIIVDGASKDKTISIVKKYEPLFDGRMKWISEPDKGIYNAMNKGISMSNGLIVGIVNSDDWLEPNALQTIIDCYKEAPEPEDSVYCGWINFHYINGDVQILKTDHQIFESWSRRFEVAGVRHPGVFVPKNVYNKHGVFDENMKVLSDCDLLLRFYFEGVRYCYPNIIVSNMSDGGVSNRQWRATSKDYKLLLNKYKLNKFKYFYLLIRFNFKTYIKYLIPAKIFYYYRFLSKA